MYIKHRKKFKAGVLVVLAIFILSAVGYSYTNAATTLPGENNLVSINNVDGQGLDGFAYINSISSDGNVILFTTIGVTNLPNSTANGGLYARNMRSGATVRVDVSTGGTPLGVGGNGSSGSIYSAVLSGSGRYAAFTTNATNLIDNKTSAMGQTYVRDLLSSTTTLASVNANGNIVGNASPTDLNAGLYDIVRGISDDGRFITLHSKEFSSSPWRPYILGYGDMSTHTWATLNTPGSSDYEGSIQSSMSCDGSFVSFEDYKGGYIVYLADMRNSGSPQVTAISGFQSIAAHISCNSNYIVYTTRNKTDITPSPSGISTGLHVIRYNRITGERIYVDSNSAGTSFDNNTMTVPAPLAQGTDSIFTPSVADTGDVVLNYRGAASLKHLSDASGTLEGLAKTSSGTYLTAPKPAYLSADGRYVTYPYNAYALGLLTASNSNLDIVRSRTGI